MDYYIDMLKNGRKAENQNHIYVAGEKEWQNETKNQTELYLQNKVFDKLNEIGREFGLGLSRLI